MTDRPSRRSLEIPQPRASRPARTPHRPRPVARLPSAEARAAATTITLESEALDVAAVMARLPAPADLPAGTLVVVPAKVEAPRSLARSVLAMLGRAKTVSRALRCSALVARGYVDVGAAEDDAHVDLAWGRVIHLSPAARGQRGSAPWPP